MHKTVHMHALRGGPRILHRYVLKEVSLAFLFCFAIFFFTGLVAGFLPLLQKGMEAGMDLTIILFQLLINALPGTLVTVLPLSITIGILLGLGRMSSDNEIAAVKSSGISVARLLPPVLLLGVIGTVLSLVCTLILIPQGIAKGRELTREALTTRADAGIEERSFFDAIKDLVVYVESIDSSTGLMRNLFIRDSSSDRAVRIIIAKTGRVAPDPKGRALVLQLWEGTIVEESPAGLSLHSASFESFVFRRYLESLTESTPARSLEESPLSAVLLTIREHREAATHTSGEKQAYHRRAYTMGWIFLAQRFAHPMACLALAVTAFPLGALSLGKGRLNNVAAGLIVIFAYYALSLAVERAARSQLIHPVIALSLPPVCFLAVGAYFMRCVRLEQPPIVVRAVQRAADVFRQRSA